MIQLITLQQDDSYLANMWINSWKASERNKKESLLTTSYELAVNGVAYNAHSKIKAP